jgi:hypothetical protein
MKSTVLMVFLSLCPLFAQADNILLKGKIVDEETGLPIIGANIVIAGTTKGAVTDFEGKITLNLPPDTCIVKISMIGYDSKCFLIDRITEEEILFELNEEQITLECTLPVISDTSEYNRKLREEEEQTNRIKAEAVKDAQEDINIGICNLIQTEQVSELQLYYSKKYPFSFVTDSNTEKIYRITYNYVLLDYLSDKYGEDFTRILHEYCWENE